MTPAAAVFYYDFSSPYSYLAAERISGLFADAGAEQPGWQPISFGHVLKHSGRRPWSFEEDRSADFEEIQRRADMRYGEQIFEIDVPLDGVDLACDDLIAQVTERFHRRHEELFTYALRDQPAVLVNARTAVIGHLSVPPAERALAQYPPDFAMPE